MRQLALAALALACTGIGVGCDGAAGPPLPTPTDRDAATFTLRFVPGIVALSVDESVTVRVEVTRSAGFDAPITLRAAPGAGLPAGLTVGTLTIAAKATAGSLTFAADDRVPLGVRYVPLEARADEVVKVAQVGLELRAPFPRIDAAFVEGASDSAEARQGNGATVLVLEGAHFDRVSDFALADLPVTVATGRTDARVRLLLSVGHGAETGPRALTTTTIGFGQAVAPAVLTITPITAGPGGDDASGHGTVDHPFRTVTRALEVAHAGDLVWLQDGSYDAAAGEAWTAQPWDATYPPAPLPAATVRDGVTIRGASRTGVVLAGSFLSGGNELGFVFAGSGRLERLTLTDFATAVVASTGVVGIEGVDLLANSEGVIALGDADVRVDAAFVQATYHDALRALGDARLTVTDALLDANLWGATVAGEARLELVGVQVTSSGLDGLRVFDGATAILRASSVEGSNLAGIHHAGHALVLRDSALVGNGGSGLLVVGDPQLVDLGRLSEPGANALSGNVPYQLHDARAAREDFFGVSLTLSATTLQGLLPDPQIEAGPVANGDLYWIEGANNLVTFY